MRGQETNWSLVGESNLFNHSIKDNEVHLIGSNNFHKQTIWLNWFHERCFVLQHGKQIADKHLHCFLQNYRQWNMPLRTMSYSNPDNHRQSSTIANTEVYCNCLPLYDRLFIIISLASDFYVPLQRYYWYYWFALINKIDFNNKRIKWK